MKRLQTRLLLGCLLFGAGTIQLVAQFPASDPRSACIASSDVRTAKIQGFLFRTDRNENTGDACLQVFEGNRLVFKRTLGNDGSYTLGQSAVGAGKQPYVPNGTDITGRHHPNMIVKGYTGGAHCCSFAYIFELEPQFRLVATIDAEDTDYAHFEFLDNEYYFSANDWTFAYWNVSFAGSPAPPILLRFIATQEGGSYHLALDKMKQPLPTPQEWKALESRARTAIDASNPQQTQGVGPDLWGIMLDLIYQGEPDLAWRLYAKSWPAKKAGKQIFLSDFCGRLKTSPYWSDLEPMLQDSPSACKKAHPSRIR